MLEVANAWSFHVVNTMMDRAKKTIESVGEAHKQVGSGVVVGKGARMCGLAEA